MTQPPYCGMSSLELNTEPSPVTPNRSVRWRFSPDGSKVFDWRLRWYHEVMGFQHGRGTQRLLLDQVAMPGPRHFQPDGTKVVTGGETSVKMWDTASGAILRTFSGHSYSLLPVTFSPNGSKVLSGDHEGTKKLWDARHRR